MSGAVYLQQWSSISYVNVRCGTMSFIFPAGIGSYLKGLLNLLQINNAASAERHSPLRDSGEGGDAEQGALKQAALCTQQSSQEGQ